MEPNDQPAMPICSSRKPLRRLRSIECALASGMNNRPAPSKPTAMPPIVGPCRRSPPGSKASTPTIQNGGGLWWNTERKYKNASTNELFLTLAARLHQRVPGHGDYLTWALREWEWF